MTDTAARATSTHPQVVVVGGGFGGFFATRALGRRLRKTNAQVTLISDTDGMLYQPLLPDVAVGALDPRSAAVPLNKTLPLARVLRGRVRAVRLDDRVVEMSGAAGTEDVPYDYLLLAPGAVTRMFDIPGLAEYAVGFKTAPEALYLRERVLAQLEAASTERDAGARREMLTFVVVGAGYAGTELTAQMARLSDNLLANFPTIRRGEVTWMLLDLAPAIMPELGKKLGVAALEVLRARGVDVRLGTSLSRVEATSVTLTDGTVLPCSTVVWAAGVAANPLVGSLGLPLNKGRLVVRPTLDVDGHPELFAIGDAAAVPDLTDRSSSGKLCPPTAQHAMRQGPAAARNIAAVIAGTPLRDYKHHDLGLVVDLGGSAAVAKPVGVTLSGWVAKIVTRGYHLFALPTAKRRLSVLAGWALAGSRPNDVTFGLVQRDHALAAQSEHHPDPGKD